MKTVEPFAPGTRVRFSMGTLKGSTGTVVRHERRYVSGSRRIRVKWDTGKETIVSSLRLRALS